MIRAVVDTNVLVSGLRNPNGNEAIFVRTALAGLVTLCASEVILAEYQEVLARPKFRFPAGVVDALMAEIRKTGEIFDPVLSPLEGPDPSDFMFMRCAIAAHADYPGDREPQALPGEMLWFGEGGKR